MIVWLIKTGEPIPSDAKNVRMMRTGILSNMLADKGHTVIWWNAGFNHSSKQFRKVSAEKLKIRSNLKIVLLKSSGYKKNVSAKRLLIDHVQLAKDFRQRCQTEPIPDIIIASFPTISLCLEAINYGKKHKIPVLIDIRDLWPEAFLDSFPDTLKPFVKIGLFPLYKRTKHICLNATGIIGIAEPFLEWGLKMAERKKNDFDAVFPFGYKKAKIDINFSNNEFPFLEKQNQKVFTFCYIGNISYNLNMKPIYEALKSLENNDIEFRFIICGRGVAMEEIKSLFNDMKNVFFTGFINANQIANIMNKVDVGIVPYVDTPNFQKSISNKVIEYLAGGLPVVTSIDGYMGPFLTSKDVGVVYKDSMTLRDNLVGLAEKKEKLNSMKSKALELYLKEFKADNVYSSYLKLIEKIVDNYKHVPNL